MNHLFKSIRSLTYRFLITFFIANNDMDIQNKQIKLKEDISNKMVNFNGNEDYLKSCPIEQDSVSDCSVLNYPCISCDRSIDCVYGGEYNYTCVTKPKIVCNVSICN